MTAQIFNLEVIPSLPQAIHRLEELANDLWYSWAPQVRALFERLDEKLWIRVGHNPKLFLRNIDQQILHKAATDPLFLTAYHHVLINYDNYRHHQPATNNGLEPDDLVAYFCAEYGFHESLPIYSGGLGILAGDHCKTASDLHLPFIAVGLFYHQGYFTQHIDAEGTQKATYNKNDPQHLPMKVVIDAQGNEILIQVPIANQQVFVKVWRLLAGHITLYLLDTDVPQNTSEDRAITYQLYGGDQHTRIKQEIVLGIGGVRMLRKLNLSPTIWHINEGHAAFLILERLREQHLRGQTFDQALETVAANTVFTTHTAVPAGHDYFNQEMVMHYLNSFANEVGLTRDEFLNLGTLPKDPPDFNMTTLAVKGSRHINGVSQVHGRVSSEICAKFWPEISAPENPVIHITNGVHVASILAREWSEMFDIYLGSEWTQHLCSEEFWQRLENIIPDSEFWKVRQSVKARMLATVRNALISQHLQNHISEPHLERFLKYLDPQNPTILTIGFARRFATYKRATLLLNDIPLLQTIVNDPDRPVIFIFSGKAHPADSPGQHLLKAIYQLSLRPEFVGKLLVVEGYDLGLSRRLVSGVDVWLNNPIYPLEASGTSGMKAAFNSGINLSVIDGWWEEGYTGDNGWAIKPSPHTNNTELRDHEDARTLYELLQDEIIPLYYDRGKYGYSPGWVKKAKRSMATILPRFNTIRMLEDYLTKVYIPASQQGKCLTADDYTKATILATWKARIRAAWEKVQIRYLDIPKEQVAYGESATIKVAVQLNQLQPEDVVVELLLSRKTYHPEIVVSTADQKRKWDKEEELASTVAYKFQPEQPLEQGEHLYTLTLKPDLCGGLSYQIRVFPFHELLTDVHEMGMMRWV